MLATAGAEYGASASLFAGRMLEQNGRLLFFASRNYDERGRFQGELTDPMPVTIAADGKLALDA